MRATHAHAPHPTTAVRAHLHPDRQVTVIVADAKAVRAGLLAAGIDVQPLVLEPGAGKVFFSR